MLEHECIFHKGNALHYLQDQRIPVIKTQEIKIPFKLLAYNISNNSAIILRILFS